MEKSSKILIIDDHEAIIAGLMPEISKYFPGSYTFRAKSRQEANRIIAQYSNFMLVIVDLSLPIQTGAEAKSEVGFELVEDLLNNSNAPNILVLSTNPKPMIRIKSKINTYEGGFAIVDKGQSIDEIMHMAETAVRGAICWSKLTRNIGFSSELEGLWLDVVKLKFQKGLNDKAIAKQLQVSDRTIRNYWIRLQDSLGIPDDPAYDVRVQIMLRLKELGVIE